MVRSYWVYILTNRRNGTLYIGVTNNLARRVWEHRQKVVPGFTQKYNLTRLVYFEETTDVRSAIAREKQLKGWLRAKKVALIEGMNPQWRDLYGDTTP
ncbi:putative endonuclease [Deinococcus reticulitermitis]|uniref:Putative endonuclease n=1 Tax=Deinococcus reticulitermitis TaxID=856736 RepID=A0A1H7CCW6_9DEIO|nr:GIY-YIG nuclease family protein [Deinococcus reticulitermitis]SEJ86427.1 putative endonuclease [Deinococcus reticulitermitis]